MRGDDAATLLPADDAEHDEDGGLRDDHRAVGGADPRERTQPDDRLLQPGDGHRGIRPAGQHRVARDGGAEVLTDARPHERDGEQATDPDGDADEVDAERVHGVLVARAAGGVAGEGDDDDAAEGEGSQPGVGRSRPGEQRATGHDERDGSRDRQHAGHLERPDEGEELAPQLGVAQAEPRERGEGEEDAEAGRDEPDDPGDGGEPRRPGCGARSSCAPARGRPRG